MGCDHIFGGSNYCHRCGVHADACNAQSLASLSAFQAAARKHVPELLAGGRRGGPVDDPPWEPPSPEELHQALDSLLAQYLREHPGKVAGKTSALELLLWSREQIEAERAAGAGRAS